MLRDFAQNWVSEMKKVAVILSGCGVFDGSEIHEAVSTLLALDQAGACYQCFAPNVAQTRVVNHLTQETKNETRNALEEAARIARGNIVDIKKANAHDFDAAIYPGGHGAALSLCDFGKKGVDMTVNADVLSFAQAMKKAGKPQGFICIAPAMISTIYGSGIEHTIGNDAATAEKITTMGGRHIACSVTQTVIDKKNKVVSTPAYMLATRIGEVFAGVKQLVEDVLAIS